MIKLSKFSALLQLGLSLVVISPFFVIRLFLFWKKRKAQRKKIEKAAMLILKTFKKVEDQTLELAVVQGTGIRFGQYIFTPIMAGLVDKGLISKILETETDRVICYYQFGSKQVSKKTGILNKLDGFLQKAKLS